MTKLLLTCEHAGNQIPPRFKKLFAKNTGVLHTHRGSDPGAFDLTSIVAKALKAPFHFTKLSRLVVDMNRSPDSPTALSRWTKALSLGEQSQIFDDYYWPYRNEISTTVDRLLKRGPVVHIGMHSFSPYIEESRSSCDIGILFDPKSAFETEIAQLLFEHFKRIFPDLGIRMNFPYRGDADGLTTDLRKSRGSKRYAGLELEFNQAFLRKLKKRKSLRPFALNVAFALESALNDLD